MTGEERIVLLICADAMQTKAYVTALSSADDHAQVRPADTIAQAQFILRECSPKVILVDESAIPPRTHLEGIVAALVEHAPVVLAANLENRDAFAFLIGSGAADVIPRTGEHAPVAAGLVARRMLLADQAGISGRGEDFGELLRHEMNNPLTGILGNAELLLSRRDRLPAQAVSKIQTIASLAVRLRETIRRLSDMWESNQGQAHAQKSHRTAL